jgi:hypothetical protein
MAPKFHYSSSSHNPFSFPRSSREPIVTRTCRGGFAFSAHRLIRPTHANEGALLLLSTHAALSRPQDSRQVATGVGIANTFIIEVCPAVRKMQSLRVLRPLGCRTGPLVLLHSDVSAPNTLRTLYMRFSTRCTADQRFRSLTHVQLASFNIKIILLRNSFVIA